MSLTQQAHQTLLSHLEKQGETQFRFSIDATCGNGFDTLFLAEVTKETVLSFDIQTAAIFSTQQRLNKTSHKNNVELIQQSHAKMLEYCQQHHAKAVGQVDAITFNLGYLPRADKSITTDADSTIAALNAATQLLSENGIISIICYRGHAGGLSESNAVLTWLKEQPLKYLITDSSAATTTTPFLLVITRNRMSSL